VTLRELCTADIEGRPISRGFLFGRRPPASLWRGAACGSIGVASNALQLQGSRPPTRRSVEGSVGILPAPVGEHGHTVGDVAARGLSERLGKKIGLPLLRRITQG